ncbi:hypothetical protein THIOM_005076 [Candidatus Thiomargarita nelsonii]|uniref:DUF4276 family protein n=1 Tax=Candidatus Thiomargarita nelsonii TaxID=1003181 RepID=A0A176RU87_9GAMM|nr:hypothetical protein THIOM_005076 [Candidatus Thiomargarita nelsonii]
MNTLVIGLYTEGETDERFLLNLIPRTLERIIEERDGSLDVFPLFPIKVPKIGDRAKEIKLAAQSAEGYAILIVHSDADAETDERAFNERIKPCFDLVTNADEPLCKDLVAIIPVQMTEAWMLADISPLKEQLGSDKTREELSVMFPLKYLEKMADPKSKIHEIIRMAFKNLPARRRKVNIGSLYSPLGQQVNLDILEQLPSYLKFKENLTEALIRLNYLR